MEAAATEEDHVKKHALYFCKIVKVRPKLVKIQEIRDDDNGLVRTVATCQSSPPTNYQFRQILYLIPLRLNLTPHLTEVLARNTVFSKSDVRRRPPSCEPRSIDDLRPRKPLLSLTLIFFSHLIIPPLTKDGQRKLHM